MSDIVVRVIPPVPDHVPGESERSLCLALLRQRLPQASEIRETLTADVRFVDAGDNFHEISCPSCGKPVELDDWAEAMMRASSSGFEQLTAKFPCCGKETSLNDLRYDWPQGFARWTLEVRSPGLSREDFESIAVELERLLGFKPRVIWALP